MSIELEKEFIIKEIKDCDEEWVLKAIKRILHHDDELDVELYNQELDDAEREIENGNFISHEDLKKEIKKW